VLYGVSVLNLDSFDLHNAINTVVLNKAETYLIVM
jgi:hypothetical protein